VSFRALLRGTETRLRSAAVLNDPDGRICGIQPTGKPPPGFGQLYYAIHWAGASADRDAREVEYVDVTHALTVTITARVGVMPDDRRGQKISDPNELLDLAEAIAEPGVIHGSYEVINAANALITGFGTTVNGFEEPLILFDYGPLKEEGPAWVGARDGKDIFVVPVRFGRARRLHL
jgi:hypothetical protein